MFEKRDDGCIRIIDMSKISSTQLSKIHNKFNYLGYGLPNVEITKNYLSRCCFLNLDQSNAVLDVLGYSSNTSMYSEEQISRDVSMAKKIFGTTYNWHKAGYVLLDGSLLDFSEGQHNRVLDHRSISEAMESSLPADYDYSLPLIMFVSYGNIRINTYGFELSKRPTKAQKRVLSSFLRTLDNAYIDVANENGNVVKSFVYEGYLSPSKIFADIEEFFDTIV